MEQYGDKYKKLAAVEEQINLNTVLNIYCDQYRRKFFTPPIFINDSHLITIKNLKKAVGDDLIELVQHYFTINDEWFKKQGYSLECLLAKINIVQASLTKKGNIVRTGHLVDAVFYCDACWEKLNKQVSFNYDYEQLVFCAQCIERKRGPMKTSKEERQRAMGMLPNGFPEMPNIKNEGE